MTVRLDSIGDPTVWYLIDDDTAAEIDGCDADPDDYFAALVGFLDDSGEPLPVVGEDITAISLQDALTIAGTYDGGEYDGEQAGIVLALVTLREHMQIILQHLPALVDIADHAEAGHTTLDSITWEHVRDVRAYADNASKLLAPHP